MENPDPRDHFIGPRRWWGAYQLEEKGMKSLTEHLVLNTEKRREFINITTEVEILVEKSEVKEGLCLVNAIWRFS